MLIIPAIDIMDGMCVRLTKGDFDSKKVYDRDPLEVAKRFESDGTQMLHIVDLDGAKMGKPVNKKLIFKLRKTVKIPIQVGGGIRDVASAQNYLECGIERVIIGTKALDNLDFIRGLLSKFSPERITVALDTTNGKLATNGWLKVSNEDIFLFAEKLKKIGVTNIIITDTLRDGTLTTPNFALIESIQTMGFEVIAAGGISDAESINQLRKMGISGAIVGKALYEGKISLPSLLDSSLTKRIILCLDVKNGRVVKGVKFEDLADAGDPVQLAKKYSDGGADELVFLDIAASKENREITIDMVRRVAEAIFIPFTVGGGITKTDDMKELLGAGADKICINTAAVKNPALIREGAIRFGSQCIVVAIDVKKCGDSYKVFIKGGSEETNLNALEWARKVEELGAGEILLTSMDRDGTRSGFDLEILSAICNAVKIPVIASGGAGSLNDLEMAIKKGKADAVLAASLFHYNETSIAKVKKYLASHNLPIRL